MPSVVSEQDIAYLNAMGMVAGEARDASLGMIADLGLDEISERSVLALHCIYESIFETQPPFFLIGGEYDGEDVFPSDAVLAMNDHYEYPHNKIITDVRDAISWARLNDLSEADYTGYVVAQATAMCRNKVHDNMISGVVAAFNQDNKVQSIFQRTVDNSPVLSHEQRVLAILGKIDFAFGVKPYSFSMSADDTLDYNA